MRIFGRSVSLYWAAAFVCVAMAVGAWSIETWNGQRLAMEEADLMPPLAKVGDYAVGGAPAAAREQNVEAERLFGVANLASEIALEARLAEFDRFLASHTSGTRRFAQSVLGMEGKARMAATGTDQLLREVGRGLDRLINGDTWYIKTTPPDPDDFRDYVWDRMDEHVVDINDIKKLIAVCADAYEEDLARIYQPGEYRLPSDPSPDIDLSPLRELPDIAIQAAQGDLIVGTAQWVVVDQIGKAVMNQYTDENTDWLRRAGANYAADSLIGDAANSLREAAGYDPEGELSRRAIEAIVRVRTSASDESEANSLRSCLKRMRGRASTAFAEALGVDATNQ